MYLMFGDETDAEQGRGQKFFVYGAVFIDTEDANKLHDGIQEIRDKFGYGNSDSLKFLGCPKDVTREQHRDVKKEVVKLARKHNVVFCAYVILHAIAKGQTHDNLVLFGANTLIGKFNEFLSLKGDVRIALVDRMPVKDGYKYMRDKFQIGLEIDGTTLELKKVIG